MSDKKFKYEEELKPFKPFIYDKYKAFNGIVYRNFLTNPPTEKDATPQSKRTDTEQPEKASIQFTLEEVESMNLKQKSKAVGRYGLSVYRTLDECVSSTQYWVNKIRSNYSLSETRQYLYEKRGPLIFPVAITEEMGLIEAVFDKTGHANFLPYDDVDINEAVIMTNPPAILNIEDEETDEEDV